MYTCKYCTHPYDSFIIGAVLGALLVVFRTQFLSLFTSDPDVLHYGSIRLGIMGCSYFVSAFMDNAAAGARGLGRSVIPTIIVIMGSVYLESYGCVQYLQVYIQ